MGRDAEFSPRNSCGDDTTFNCILTPTKLNLFITGGARGEPIIIAREDQYYISATDNLEETIIMVERLSCDRWRW